jgi:hypothetical protein
MNDQGGPPQPGTTRAGVLYAMLAAASAALLLFLPVLLLGITMSVVASVERGEIVAWQSNVAMTYVFIGIPALATLVLLFIPSALFARARRRLGDRRAIRLVGGLLVAWHVGVALLWIRAAVSAFTPATERPEIWYAVAFGIAAIVTLIAIIVADRQAMRAAVALVGGLGVALIALVLMLISVWGSPPRIAADAQVVHVVVTASEVHLDPATVHAGQVYFLVEGPDDPAEHAGFAFVSAGYAEDSSPLPMTDRAVERLSRGDYQGTGIESGWGKYATYRLREGNYAFLVAGPEGDLPSVPPQSMAVLEVLP